MWRHSELPPSSTEYMWYSGWYSAEYTLIRTWNAELPFTTVRMSLLISTMSSPCHHYEWQEKLAFLLRYPLILYILGKSSPLFQWNQVVRLHLKVFTVRLRKKWWAVFYLQGWWSVRASREIDLKHLIHCLKEWDTNF